jgi:hypothetical protein
MGISGFLDRLLNKLPFMSAINGYKTKIAGMGLAIAVVLVQLSNFLPAEYATPVLVIAEGFKQLASVLSVIGVSGGLAKAAVDAKAKSAAKADEQK